LITRDHGLAVPGVLEDVGQHGAQLPHTIGHHYPEFSEPARSDAFRELCRVTLYLHSSVIRRSYCYGF
jgi:hypothetical protein